MTALSIRAVVVVAVIFGSDEKLLVGIIESRSPSSLYSDSYSIHSHLFHFRSSLPSSLDQPHSHTMRSLYLNYEKVPSAILFTYAHVRLNTLASSFYGC